MSKKLLDAVETDEPVVLRFEGKASRYVREEQKRSKKCVVLLSGGVDSTVLMYSLIADYEVWPLTINYGQTHSKEVLAARNVCEARGKWLLERWKYVNLGVLSTLLPSALTGVGEIPKGEYDKDTMSLTVVPNRNMIFLAIAAGYAEGISAQYVAYAAHAEDHYLYPDCRPEFATACAEAILCGTGNKVALFTPFINKSKTDVVALGKKLTVPFKFTWSCYEGGDVHCGQCGTCLERRAAFKKAKVPDPTEYLGVLRYREFYNKNRGLPEPKWGVRCPGLQCTWCNSQDMYFSGSPDDPEEILHETVRCGHCGRITDWYGAHKQRENHPTEIVLEVVR